jgi:peptidoglycan glycosyltransferase
MNTTVRRSALVIGGLIVALMVNATLIAVVFGNDYKNRDGNARLIIAEYDHERGPIVVGNRPVARSTPTDGRLKYQRVYRDGPLYAPATGYYSLYGATGMEKAANPLLSGTDDRLFVDRLNTLLSGRQPRGGSVTLTLNAAAQQAAYVGLNGQRGAVVALDPRTGAILAMASSPSYDPNLLASHDPAKVSDAYDRMVADPRDPLLNRPIQQTYPPGSLFKVVVSAAALSSGKFTPRTVVPGPAVLDLPQTSADLHNYDDRPCLGGSLTVAQALAISCNTAFGHIGLALGDDAIRAQAEKFGFNHAFSVPLAVVPSIYPPDLNAPQTAQSAIGQFDVRATALQMAMVGAGVANNGVVMNPYLVVEERAPDLSTLAVTQPTVFSRAVTPEVAAELTDMMVGVVTSGTGGNAAIPGVSVAGKTGTAETGPNAPPHVWFLAFAPAYDPKVAVAVIVENGGRLGNEATGGAVAAPIARSVIEAVLGS